jgi:hypothetical protein
MAERLWRVLKFVGLNGGKVIRIGSERKMTNEEIEKVVDDLTNLSVKFDLMPYFDFMESNVPIPTVYYSSFETKEEMLEYIKQEEAKTVKITSITDVIKQYEQDALENGHLRDIYHDDWGMSEMYGADAEKYQITAEWLRELEQYRRITRLMRSGKLKSKNQPSKLLDYIREYRQQCEDDCKGNEKCERCNQMLFDEIEAIVRRELDD